MGTSTDGIIAYGIAFEEEFEFPWDEELPYCEAGEIEDWWLHIHDFYNTSDYPFTLEGEYKEGKAEADCSVWFKKKDAFLKEHPVPVEKENYCSGDYPMYALIVPGTAFRAKRGYPANFYLEDLMKITVKQIEDFKEFLDKYKLVYETEPAWLLMSYWG